MQRLAVTAGQYLHTVRSGHLMGAPSPSSPLTLSLGPCSIAWSCMTPGRALSSKGNYFARFWRPPNQRLKLSGRGGRLKGNGSVLIAAAAPRSLSATRWAAH